MTTTAVPSTSTSPLQQFVPAVEWMVIEPLIEEIQALKKDRKAVVLAHNYQVPTIYRGVADFTGDSLALARQAVASESPFQPDSYICHHGACSRFCSGVA